MSMILSELGSVLRFVAPAAPLLATIVGGPLGELVGPLLSFILGLPHDSSSSTLNTALQTVPNAKSLIESYEAQHQEDLQQMVYHQQQLDALDRQNSRVAADKSVIRWVVYGLAVFIILLLICMPLGFFLFNTELNSQELSMTKLILPQILALSGAAGAFLFGTYHALNK